MKSFIFIRFSIVFTLLFFSPFNLMSQKSMDEEMRILENPFQRFNYQKTDSIFNSWDKELKLALKKKDSSALGKLYLKMGVVFGLLADYDKSTKYLYHAEKVFSATGDKKRLAYTYFCLALIANIDTDKKFQFLEKSYSVYAKQQDTMRLSLVLNAYGVVYARENMLDSAILYFRKARDFALKSDYTHLYAMAMGNIANWHAHMGNFEKALELSREAINKMPEEHFINTIGIKFNILDIYRKRSMPDSLLSTYKRYKQDLAKRPSVLLQTYNLISNVYSDFGDDKKAFVYHKKADSLQTMINERNNKNLLQILDLEHESELKQNEIRELQIQAEKDRAIYIALTIVFIVTVAFSIVLYYFQKEKIKRNREARIRAETEQKLVESELKNSELQRATLNDELKFTNKELSSYAANIVKSTDHLNEIKNQINTAIDEKNPKKIKDQLRELNVMVNQLFHKDEERKKFIERTRQINHSLIFFLKSSYPQLNDNDLNLMVLLMLKFSSKEIATLSNLEAGSVVTKRYRLRKKIGLTDRRSFEEFIEELIKEFKVVHQDT